MKKKRQEEGQSVWQRTFLDIMMLLLTFFVLLMSMVTFEKIKLEQAAGSLRESFGMLRQGVKKEVKEESIFDTTSILEDIHSKKELLSGLVNYIESVNLKNFISVIETDKGFTIRIQDELLFDLGSTEIKSSAYPLLDKIASIANNTPYNILVEGHTDDLPMKYGAKYDTNWELSTARAASVVKYFINKGINPKKLAAAGYSKYHPLVPNINSENRRKNRRVEINFISPEFMRKAMQ
ncbi:MAG: OmpA family protein [Deferribacterota bacterium]|nr:OmpA family protein [Deferribacterota bacterium]